MGKNIQIFKRLRYFHEFKLDLIETLYVHALRKMTDTGCSGSQGNTALSYLPRCGRGAA